MPVLFDLDGTLLDTAPDFAFVLNTLRAKINLPPLNPDTLRAAVSEGVATLIQMSFGYEPEHPESVVLCSDFLNLYQDNICQFTQPFPGVLSLLSSLEQMNIPWGIVTNKPEHLTHSLLHKISLKNRAACVVSGDTTPHAKPHPAPLLYACDLLQVDPKHCIYVGDAERDIQAGNRAGMTTIAALFGYITNFETTKQWGAHHYVNTVEEILPYIQQWHSSKEVRL